MEIITKVYIILPKAIRHITLGTINHFLAAAPRKWLMKRKTVLSEDYNNALGNWAYFSCSGLGTVGHKGRRSIKSRLSGLPAGKRPLAANIYLYKITWGVKQRCIAKIKWKPSPLSFDMSTCYILKPLVWIGWKRNYGSNGSAHETTRRTDLLRRTWNHWANWFTV